MIHFRVALLQRSRNSPQTSGYVYADCTFLTSGSFIGLFLYAMHHIYGTSPIKTMPRILPGNPGHVQSFPFNSNRLSDYNDDATCSPYTTLEFAVYFFLVQNFIGEKSCPFSALKLSMHYHFRSTNIAQYVYSKPSLTKGFLYPHLRMRSVLQS